MKKITLLTLVVILLLGMQPVYAYKIPNKFWPIDSKYQSAVNSNDYSNIITYATQEIDLMKSQPQNETVLQILGSRTEMLAKSYEALGNYPMAADYFEQYVYYAQALHWDDAVRISKAKVLHYRPRLDIYEQINDPSVYFNAINEPTMGVLFGVTSDAGIRNQLTDESVILLYHQFGSTDFGWLNHIFYQAQEKNICVELALNVLYEGNDIRQTAASGAFFDALFAELNQYPTVPVFFRFASEMNVWSNPCTPQEFITAFQYVANRVHNEVPQAAMVWSVNQSSSWNINMHDYYPGDQYVDWVGVSSYLGKYFLGRNDWSAEEQFNDNLFFAGDSADAVLALEEIVTTYGDRKPIMLSESGVSHYINSLGIDETAWAIDHLHQMYEYLPKVYPQIKAILYFDKRMPAEVNDYALSDNNVLANEYLMEVSHPYFIHGGETSSQVTYRKIDNYVKVTDDVLVFGVYPHVYKNTTPQVDVYFDGYYITGLTAPHYLATLDFSNESAGLHELKVAVNGVIEKTYQLEIVHPIQLFLNGQQLNSDVAPEIIDGRTLVPVRIITENLGANVEWFGDRREVSVSKDGVSILMGINYPNVIVNGEYETIDVAPQIINNRTMVPIRFLAEKFNLNVAWDEVNRSVYLTH
ncbi:MAG: hypothetical protein J6A61_08380 [Clostridia bacterium]|nr:hypothetical protein [Clostridia bacterium]